jgi:hypothetical protein
MESRSLVLMLICVCMSALIVWGQNGTIMIRKNDTLCPCTVTYSDTSPGNSMVTISMMGFKGLTKKETKQLMDTLSWKGRRFIPTEDSIKNLVHPVCHLKNVDLSNVALFIRKPGEPFATIVLTYIPVKKKRKK